MTRKARIKIIISILIIVLVGTLISMSLYNKPHTDVAKSSPNISLASKTLLDDFENDENLANSKYLEQIIQVSGTISELSVSKGKGIVTLGNKDSFGNIMCHLSAKENEKMTALEKGQSITIKGICTGYLMDVILVKCVIIN